MAKILTEDQEQALLKLLWDFLPPEPEGARRTGWGAKDRKGLLRSIERICFEEPPKPRWKVRYNPPANCYEVKQAGGVPVRIVMGDIATEMPDLPVKLVDMARRHPWAWCSEEEVDGE